MRPVKVLSAAGIVVAGLNMPEPHNGCHMRLKIMMASGGLTVPCKLPGSVILDGSVGYNGSNGKSDVAAIQCSLNAVMPNMGGAMAILAEDGIAGPKTQNAILRFQTHWVNFRDSRIDPGGATLRALNRAVGASLAAAPAGPSIVQAGPKPPKPPQVSDADKLAIMKAAIRYATVKALWLPACYQAALSAVRVATRAANYAARLPIPDVAREDPDRLAFLLVAKHFKLHEKHPAEARTGARRIETFCRRMALALTNRVGKSLPGLTPGTEIIVSLWRTPSIVAGHPGYTWYGGAYERHRMLGNVHTGEEVGKISPDFADRIYLTPVFDESHDAYRLHVLVHELAHFIGDMTGGWTLGDLGYASQPKYAANNSIQRQRNADAYACFIREAGVGTMEAAKGAQADPSVFGKGPVVHKPETPVFPPVPAAPAKDPYAYPSGGV